MNTEKTRIVVSQFDNGGRYQVIINDSVPIIYSCLNGALDWVFNYYNHDNAIISIDTRGIKS